MSASAEHGHGHHPPYLAHHFHNMTQQSDSNKMGMWLFLVQEVLFFAGLFMAYTAMRYLYPGTWLAAAEELDKVMGAVNTVVLLTRRSPWRSVFGPPRWATTRQSPAGVRPRSSEPTGSW